MGLRQCDKCSEMVDEAKAFCPGCGHAFVEEEKRQEASKFEKLDNTVQFGQTMYSQMLEDMGLNISNAPDRGEKRVEVIAPIQAEMVSPPAKVIVPVGAAVKQLEKGPEKRVSAGNTKWYILIGAAVIFLLPIALASAIFLFFEIWSRLK